MVPRCSSCYLASQHSKASENLWLTKETRNVREGRRRKIKREGGTPLIKSWLRPWGEREGERVASCFIYPDNINNLSCCLSMQVLRRESVSTTSPMDASLAIAVNFFTALLKSWQTKWRRTTPRYMLETGQALATEVPMARHGCLVTTIILHLQDNIQTLVKRWTHLCQTRLESQIDCHYIIILVLYCCIMSLSVYVYYVTLLAYLSTTFFLSSV